LADLFYTLLIVWVLWRIFGGTSRTTVNHHYQQPQQPQKKEGEVSISSAPGYDTKSNTDAGEYVDYEEVK
jgi:hypothetical protein